MLCSQIVDFPTGARRATAAPQAAATERRERRLQRSDSAAVRSAQVTKVDTGSTYTADLRTDFHSVNRV